VISRVLSRRPRREDSRTFTLTLLCAPTTIRMWMIPSTISRMPYPGRELTCSGLISRPQAATTAGAVPLRMLNISKAQSALHNQPDSMSAFILARASGVTLWARTPNSRTILCGTLIRTALRTSMTSSHSEDGLLLPRSSMPGTDRRNAPALVV